MRGKSGAGAFSTQANKVNPRTRLKLQFAELSRQGTDLQTMMDLWLEIVKAYFQLRLTYETDRLPALSGIASHLATLFNTSYVAGLWKEDLLRCLLWEKRVVDTQKTKKNPGDISSYLVMGFHSVGHQHSS
jgi:hypothetical protein